MAADSGKVVSGLDGVLAFESTIAYIDGHKPEFSVRGYDIGELAHGLGYEQMAHLLWTGRVPTGRELTDVKSELAGLRQVPASVVNILRDTSATAHPMAALRTAVSLLGSLDKDADDISPDGIVRKAKSLTAKPGRRRPRTPSRSPGHGRQRAPGEEFRQDPIRQQHLDATWR